MKETDRYSGIDGTLLRVDSEDINQIRAFVDGLSVDGAFNSISISATDNKFWNCLGAVAEMESVSSSYKAYDAVTVSPGDIYTIYSRVGNTHKARPYLLVNNDYEIISSPGDCFGVAKKTYVIVVPEGCTKLLLTTAGDSGTPDLKKYIHDSMKYRGSISALGVTRLSDCNETGWYGCGSSYVSSLLDLPSDFDTNSAITLFVFKYAFNSGNNASGIDTWHEQFLIGSNRSMYKRRIGSIVYDWENLMYGGGSSALYGKRVAIIGDSISTNGISGELANVPEITIEEDDVGVQLSAYPTYYDVQAGLSLGGHSFTMSEVGSEVTFTPISTDIGKTIGLASNYNPSSTVVWWEVAAAALGFIPVPNCWSGASVTSHEDSKNEYKTSYAWHRATIRKCGVRIPGTMTRYDPDVIIIYRGTNDMTHSSISGTPFQSDVVLTNDYFENYNWQYPQNDSVTGGYGFKEALCITILRLRNTYPNAKIFLCTLNVFKRINYSHFPTNNGVNSLPQYNDAIREVANFMGCGLIEFDKDGITFENCYSQGYITDNEDHPTHPSNKGHKTMGNKAIADLSAQYSSIN